MPRPPELELAVDVLGMLGGPGLVSVRGDEVVVVAVRDGRAGRSEGTGIEEGNLERVVRTAWLRAGQARAWPVLGLPAATVGEVDRGGPIREAVATTWGTRTFETRFPAGPTQNSKRSTFGWVRLQDGRVLGPHAVGELLRALAPVYGVELQLGEPPPPTTTAVTLIDDGRESHSFDAEGTARQRVVIVNQGHFVQGVRDGADSTGHATRPLTLASSADHLRFARGDEELGSANVETLGALRSPEARVLLSQVVAVG